MQMVKVTKLEGDVKRGRAEQLMAHMTPYLAASSQNDLSFIPCIYTLIYTLEQKQMVDTDLCWI